MDNCFSLFCYLKVDSFLFGNLFDRRNVTFEVHGVLDSGNGRRRLSDVELLTVADRDLSHLLLLWNPDKRCCKLRIKCVWIFVRIC